MFTIKISVNFFLICFSFSLLASDDRGTERAKIQAVVAAQEAKNAELLIEMLGSDEKQACLLSERNELRFCEPNFI